MSVIFKKNGYAPLSMDPLEITKMIDSESIRISVNFYIGNTKIKIEGSLNIVTNTFHHDFDFCADVFDGYPPLEEFIEKR